MSGLWVFSCTIWRAFSSKQPSFFLERNSLNFLPFSSEKSAVNELATFSTCDSETQWRVYVGKTHQKTRNLRVTHLACLAKCAGNFVWKWQTFTTAEKNADRPRESGFSLERKFESEIFSRPLNFSSFRQCNFRTRQRRFENFALFKKKYIKLSKWKIICGISWEKSKNTNWRANKDNWHELRIRFRLKTPAIKVFQEI